MSVFGPGLILGLVLSALSAGACGSESDDQQAELQALLRDEELQQVPPGAVQRTQSASTVPDGGAPGAALTAQSVVISNWKFDDCSPAQTQLRDSTFAFPNNSAFRSVNAACVGGVQGQGVAIAATEDIVYVPDQPSFVFEQGVTVGGWFKPASTGGTRTLLRKRDKGTSSFALLLNGGKFQFVASFGPGRAASVTSPGKAKAGVFQHVAATYDGTALRLYVGGAEVNRLDVSGTIPVGAGPLLMGNDGSERRFDGTIDSVTFATRAFESDQVQQLICLPETPSFAITPTEFPPTLAGTPIALDLAFTNRNPANCAPLVFEVGAFTQRLRFELPGGGATTMPIPSGTTAHVTATATPALSASPGDDVTLTFQILEPTTNFFAFQELDFAIAPPTGCRADVHHELMITNVSVVGDPIRTRVDLIPGDPRNGAWSIKRLFEDMAPTPEDAPAMVEALLGTFTTPQVINSFTVETRPGMQREILAAWPRTADGKLDLASPPLRLQAIVNRVDLRNLANGDAGEGRFVFAFMRPDGDPFQATLILEYKLPAANEHDALAWAQSFHALGAMPFGESYNAALQAITDRFVRRGARPDQINGSAISSVRTNEIDFSEDFVWQLRQFDLSPTTGLIVPVPLDLTPDRSFDNTATLASYINANQAQIIAETHTVPAVFDGKPFQAGAVFNDLTTWLAPGVDPSARHHFALNTCNGCHSAEETGVGFLQISAHGGAEAELSPFLTGGTVADKVTGQMRFFDDLGRRKLDLESIVCAPSSAQAGPALRAGIRRVH